MVVLIYLLIVPVARTFGIVVATIKDSISARRESDLTDEHLLVLIAIVIIIIASNLVSGGRLAFVVEVLRIAALRATTSAVDNQIRAT